MAFAGAFGAVVRLFPRLYRRVATALVYVRPAAVERNDRFTRWVRVIGALYLLLANGWFGRARTED